MVCHRHASRVGAVTSASSSAVGAVKRLKVKHVERGFPNSGDEKLGRFKTTSRGEGPLLDGRPERFKPTKGSGLCCISLANPCLMDEEEEVGADIIHNRDYCTVRNCSIGALFNGPHEDPDDFSVGAVRERH